MLNELSSEQKDLMVKVRQEWLDRIFSCTNTINREDASRGIDWMYALSKLNEPIKIFVDSPLGCQYAIWMLKALLKSAQVRAQVGDQVRDQVGAQVWAQVRAQGFEYFSSYGNISDYNWMAFFDFFERIGIVKHEGFSEFKNLISSNVYDMVQIQGTCIVSNLPNIVKRNSRNQLHCADGPAIAFRDGFKLYYWNGVAVPISWIESPELINKETIISESNAEKRRCLREMLGAREYYERAFGKDGLVLLDQDTDDRGHIMKLYQTKNEDDVINKRVQFLEVICPSTLRVYNIYPPSQNATNVWAAKSDTFSNEKIQIRHGDVGLLNLNKSFSKPVLES
jgi:hypothetical protein